MRQIAARPYIPRQLLGALELKDDEGGTALADPPLLDRQDRRMKSLTMPLEIKLDSVNAEARTFEGMGAAFSQDLGGDVILPGAFKRTISDWKKSSRILPLLDSHNGYGTVRAVVGKVLDAKEVTEGLWTKSAIIDGPDGDEVLRRVKGGYVDGLSIGYKAVQIKVPTDEEAQRGIWRFLKEVALKELSVCIWPMNPDARIDLGSVKHLLAEAKSRSLDPDELDDLKSVACQIRALLAASAPGTEDPPAPKLDGLALEDPRRIALEAKVRDLRLRGLGVVPA